MKRNLAAIAVVLLLLGLALYGNLEHRQESMEERPSEGFRAPSFELAGLDGRTYSTQNLDKPLVINFWASWCDPCRTEAPMLTGLYRQYKDQVEVYAVNLTANDQLEKAKAFSEQFHFEFPVLLDEKGEVAKRYQVVSIPTTFFVDRHGTIFKSVIGLHPQEELDRLFRQLIDIK